ncbi:glycosyltransferase [Montanilutibacter psychrotolerans]|nr:glycosyltransferase [Lysobacter psychrotolerans]
MRITVVAKRHYTKKDAFAESFGRVYQLPLQWHRDGHQVQLHLLDYHSLRRDHTARDGFDVYAEPAASPLALRRIVRAQARFNPDVVIGSGDSAIGLLGRWIARRQGARFVFDAYDDYRRFGNSRLFLGWDAYGWLVNRADVVMYASQRLADEHSGSAASVIVPNGVDPAQFAPADLARSRSDNALPPPEQVRLVGYFGSMERDRGVDVLIEAVRKLHCNDPRVRLLLAGRKRDDMQLDAAWIHYVGQVDHRSIPGLLNACDVVALPYLLSPLMDMGASCKIAEYLFCRRPLAATRTPNFLCNFPHQAQALADRLASPGDADDLARVLSLQLDTPSIAPVPEEMAWQRIAHQAAAAFG